MFENFHDYIFRVKCNNTPAMTVRLVAGDYEKAVSYAKNMSAAISMRKVQSQITIKENYFGG